MTGCKDYVRNDLNSIAWGINANDVSYNIFTCVLNRKFA